MVDPRVVGKKVVYGKSSLVKQYNTPSLHAEIDAYKKLPRYYAGKELNMIVVRFSNEGKLCQSRPCFHCLQTLSNSGIRIKNVYYSNDGEMCKEKFSTMMESELTTISSGMRMKSRMQSNIENEPKSSRSPRSPKSSRSSSSSSESRRSQKIHQDKNYYV
jgi:deoxycytidylate deaminase